MSVALFSLGGPDMMKLSNKFSIQKRIFVSLSTLVFLGSSLCFAKVRTVQIQKPKGLDLSFIKGVHGEASFQVQQKLTLTSPALQFQDGHLTQEIEFFKSPRCYLHFRKSGKTDLSVDQGAVLKVSKIDNVYANGAVRVTFWFDNDPVLSDLSCVTNSGHTLTSTELKSTLGSFFQVSLSKSVETGALFNTAPTRNHGALTENALSNRFSTPSARVVLSGS